VWARTARGDFCDPTSIVVAVWAVSFGLYVLRMLPYGPISAAAAATLALGVGCLLAGIGVGRRLARGPVPQVRPAPGIDIWLSAFGGLGIAGACWYLAEVHHVGGWEALRHAAHLRIALANYRIPSRFLFLEFFCIVAPIVGVSLAVTGHRLRRGHWLLVVGCVAATWVSTDRTQFFMIVLTSFFMYLYRHGPRLSLSRFLVATGTSGLLLVSSFLAIGYWTGRTPERLGLPLTLPGPSAAAPVPPPGATSVPTPDSTTPDRAVAGGGPSTLLAKASTLYMYTTASYAAFAIAFPLDRPRTWGVHAIYPIARALQRLGWIRAELPPPIPRFVVVASRNHRRVFFNGYTLLFYPLRDFGVAGVVVYCLAIGLGCGYVYERTRHARQSPLHLLVVAQASVGLALSIFVNKFNNTASWYVLALTAAPFLVPGAARRLRQVIGRLARRPSTRALVP
jgi:hypothetical protein